MRFPLTNLRCPICTQIKDLLGRSVRASKRFLMKSLPYAGNLTSCSIGVFTGYLWASDSLEGPTFFSLLVGGTIVVVALDLLRTLLQETERDLIVKQDKLLADYSVAYKDLLGRYSALLHEIMAAARPKGDDEQTRS